MPFFVMKCLHHTNVGDKKEAVRPLHRAWVDSGSEGLVSVLLGSAIVNDDKQAIGHWGILEARTKADAMAFAEDDAFNVKGIVASIELTQLASTFQAHRVTEPMSLRLSKDEMRG